MRADVIARLAIEYECAYNSMPVRAGNLERSGLCFLSNKDTW